MKKLIFILSIITASAQAQSVEVNFIHLKDNKLKTAVIDNLPRFTKSLHGFGVADSVSINYDMHRNSVFIMHNISDVNKINLLYMNFLIHCAYLKTIQPNTRLEFTKILVEHLDNRFLVAEYSDLVYMSGTREAKWYTANYKHTKPNQTQIASAK